MTGSSAGVLGVLGVLSPAYLFPPPTQLVALASNEFELLPRAINFNPVRDIALRRARRPVLFQVQKADTCCNGGELLRHTLGMRAPGNVIVRDDNDVGALEIWGNLILPIACPSGARCRADAHSGKVVSVLLAFNDDDGLLSRNSRIYLWQTIR